MKENNLTNEQQEYTGIKRYLVKNIGLHRLFFRYILVIAIVFIVFILFTAVPSGSMEPTVETGSLIFSYKLAYVGDSVPEREDVVVFATPDKEHTLYVKRIMGMPGDKLDIKDGKLYINGEEYSEPFKAEPYGQDFPNIYVPKAGDVVEVINAPDETKCYINGYLVGTGSFLNKYCIYENEQYIVENDCYFMLGDNCNLSEDSRFWTNKYVTEDDIKGKTFLEVFPKPQIIK